MATQIPSVDYVLQFKLWSRVKVQDPKNFYDSCWLFQGQCSDFGHGRLSHKRIFYGAHRVAYMLAHGLTSLSEDIVVRHKCDTPNCVNPLHLETGTKADNDLDREVRGRTLKGVDHGMSHFTDTRIIREIRWLYQQADGAKGACTALGVRYGESKTVIRYICTRQTWKDVADNFETLEPKPAPLTRAEMYRNTKNHGGSFLGRTDIQKIRAFRELGASLAWISDRFDGLSESAISTIANWRRWKRVPVAKPEDVLTPEEITACLSAKP